MTAPRISVLMPCYNHGAFIDEAVESVFAQTVQDFEILIVDDGSTDPETVAKLRGYAAPRTTVFRTANQGLPAARNYAAARAAGSLFCALDSDDRLAPKWFEKGLAVLDARPEIAFVSHWLETFGDEHWVWQPERCDLASLLARNTVNGAALVRREAFAAVGGYDADLRQGCEDWDLWLRLVEHGFAGTIVQEVLFYYRRRADSMSRNMVERDYRGPLTDLIARHEPAFRSHAIDALVSGAREFVTLSDEIERLESDRLTTLAPALRRAEEEARALRNQRERAESRIPARVLRNEVARLEATLSAEREHSHDTIEDLTHRLEVEQARARTMGAALDALGHERARLAATAENAGALERHVRYLEGELSRSGANAAALQQELSGLRTSLSWKLTAPVRRAIDRLRGR